MTPLLVFGGIFCFAMGWANGANDIANSFAVAVGSKTITVTAALIVGAFFEFLGAVLTGTSVAKAISKGIVEPKAFQADERGVDMFAAAMFSVLVGTFAWTWFATWKALPVSITHGIIGSLVGVTILALGSEAVVWDKIGMTALSWVISPVMGGLFSGILWLATKFLIFNGDDAKSERMSKLLVPVYVALTVGILTLFIIVKGPPAVVSAIEGLPTLNWILPIVVGSVSGIVCFALLSRLDACLKNKASLAAVDPTAELATLTSDETAAAESKLTVTSSVEVTVSLDSVEATAPDKKKVQERPGEYLFQILVVLSACIVAFAHGGNDVGNAIGPYASLLEMEMLNKIVSKPSIPTWVLLLGAASFAIGVLSYGKNVIFTVGTGITALTPARAYCAQFGAAISIMIASALGLPVSTSHIICGSVIFVGLADCGDVQWIKLKRVFLSWIITIPAAMGVSMLVFALVDYDNYRNGK